MLTTFIQKKPKTNAKQKITQHTKGRKINSRSKKCILRILCKAAGSKYGTI